MSAPVLLVPKAPVLKVVHDPEREKATRGMKSYTITIDGVPSLMWFQTEYAALRSISRLQLGRSGEAFGASGVAGTSAQSVAAAAKGKREAGRGRVEKSAEEVVTSTAKTKSGKDKVKETQPGYVYTLDGGDPVHVLTEKDAKALCAISAFQTRGKLNPKKHKEAEFAFREQHDKDCKVHQVGTNIVAKDEDGLLWISSFNKQSGDWQFKMIGKQ